MMKQLRRIASWALFLGLGSVIPLLADPAAILYRGGGPSSDSQVERLVLLTLEAGPEGVHLVDALVAPGRAKTIEGEGSDISRGYLFRVTNASGAALLAGQFQIPWILHGDDLVEESGTLACTSVEQERVVFVLKLPWVDGISAIDFYEVGFQAEPAIFLVLEKLSEQGESPGFRDFGTGALGSRMRFLGEVSP